MTRTAAVTRDHKVSIENKKLRALKPGEALVQTEYCSVCRTDLHVENADLGDATDVTLGRGSTGKAIEVAEGVESLKIGNRVSIARMLEGCGRCEYCTTGHGTLYRNVKNIGYIVDGAMAGQVIITADYAVKVSERLNPTATFSITCAGVITYKVVKVSNVKPGQRLDVFSIGGLDDLALQYAKNVMGVKIVAFDTNDDKLAFIKELGADTIISPRDVDPVAEVMKLADNRGLDATVVTSVAKTSFNQAADVVEAGARVVAVGLPVDKMNSDIPRLILDGIEVVGSLVGIKQDLREMFEFAAESKVTPKVQLRKLEEINDIFGEVENSTITGGMIIKF